MVWVCGVCVYVCAGVWYICTVNYWKRQAQRGSETHQGIWSQGGFPLCMCGRWLNLTFNYLKIHLTCELNLCRFKSFVEENSETDYGNETDLSSSLLIPLHVWPAPHCTLDFKSMFWWPVNSSYVDVNLHAICLIFICKEKKSPNEILHCMFEVESDTDLIPNWMSVLSLGITNQQKQITWSKTLCIWDLYSIKQNIITVWSCGKLCSGF